MNTSSSAVRARGLIVLFLLSTTSAHGVSLVVETNPPITELKLLPPGGVFHTTTATVTESALIEVANTTTLLMHWKETVGAGSPIPYYAFSLDSGTNVSRVRSRLRIHLYSLYSSPDRLQEKSPGRTTWTHHYNTL